MYLSFIQEEKDKLARQLDRLEEVESAFEERAGDILYRLQEDMREMITDAIDEVFSEYGIEDNYYDEKSQEVMDALSEQIQQEF